MGSTFGREVIETIGGSIQLTADGKPFFKAGGVTVDWSTVAAITGSDVTYEDGVLVKVGEKALRYGQLLTLITASGMYGPYDPAASDGRQTLAKGAAFLVNQTVREVDPKSAHPPVIDGGRVFKNRLLATAGTHSLAAGPTFAELEAVITLRYVAETA